MRGSCSPAYWSDLSVAVSRRSCVAATVLAGCRRRSNGEPLRSHNVAPDDEVVLGIKSRPAIQFIKQLIIDLDPAGSQQPAQDKHLVRRARKAYLDRLVS